MDNLFHIGIDIGSTTVKFVILDTNKNNTIQITTSDI